MGAAAVAVLVAKERHIVEAFRRARALDPQSAVLPSSIGVSERLAFHKLRQHAVLRESRPGTFYLDDPSWQALSSMRRRMGIVVLVIVAVAAIATWLAARSAGAVP